MPSRLRRAKFQKKIQHKYNILGLQTGSRHEEAIYIAAYPENRMPGALPASVFYLRHVKNIAFDNIRIYSQAPDQRPAFVPDDVTGFEYDRCSIHIEKLAL